MGINMEVMNELNKLQRDKDNFQLISVITCVLSLLHNKKNSLVCER